MARTKSHPRKKIWQRKNPKQAHKTMTPAERRAAKRAAKRAGRSKPGLVDNINAMRKRRGSNKQA